MANLTLVSHHGLRSCCSNVKQKGITIEYYQWGNIRVILGLYGNNGKENGIVEKKVETTIL